MEQHFAIVNGAACRYALAGEGETTLVLVHELGGSLASWDALIRLLPPSLRVLRYDLRGAGMSEKVRGTQKLDTLADDLRALLDHLGIHGDVCVLGAAAGAAVAVRLATRHPQLPDRLILLAPALGVPAERRDAALAVADRLDGEGLRAVADAILPRAFPDALWADPAAKAEALARWFGADPEGYAATYRALVGEGVMAELDRISCRTLLIAGAHDPFNSPEEQARSADAIPDCRFEIVDVGHFMAVQSPEAIAGLLSDFVGLPVERGSAT